MLKNFSLKIQKIFHSRNIGVKNYPPPLKTNLPKLITARNYLNTLVGIFATYTLGGTWGIYINNRLNGNPLCWNMFMIIFQIDWLTRSSKTITDVYKFLLFSKNFRKKNLINFKHRSLSWSSFSISIYFELESW